MGDGPHIVQLIFYTVQCLYNKQGLHEFYTVKKRSWFHVGFNPKVLVNENIYNEKIDSISEAG